MISTMNEALATLKKMNTTQVNDFVWNLELEGWYRENRRRTRSWCAEVIISNWNYDKHAVLRAMYNAIG